MTIPGAISTRQQIMAVEPRTTQVCSKPATILLVDDDAGVRHFVEFALATSGYKVVVCATGEKALQQESEYTGIIDLILTDLTMPGMNGMDTASTIAERRPGIKVVLMSGYSQEDHLKSITIDAFITKPFTASTLLSSIRRVLDRSEKLV